METKEINVQMTQQLKTLEDLRSLRDDCFVDWHLLRQEAIKWIKEMKGKPYFTFPDGERTNLIFSKDDIETLTFWIKHFFNITDEELK